MNSVKDNGSTIKKFRDGIPDNRDKSKFDDVENHLEKFGSTICESSAASYNTQERNWLFLPAEYPEPGTDCQENSKCRIPKTQTTSIEEHFRMTTSSRTQSEASAITSWDEWDETSDMLSHIDPITATKKSIKMYN